MSEKKKPVGEASRQKSSSRSVEGTASASRQPLGETKPPRSWRTVRTDESRVAKTPRFAKHVTAEESSLPAGSGAPEPVIPSAPPASAPPSPPAPHTAPSEAAGDLRHRYGVDRLVILVRDPYWVYAWWELTEATLHSGRLEIGAPGDLVLRMYDISALDWDGTNHHEHFDIEIGDLAGNWYIELGRPGGSFVAEVGLRGPDGKFLALLRSNFVTLPRDSMSPVVDEEWMVVEEDYRTLFELAGGGSIGLGSGEFQRLLEQRLRSELSSGGVGSFGISSFGISSPETSRSRKS